jgi:hypothetical protein
VRDEGIADEAELVGARLLGVHGGNEGAAFSGEHGLRVLGVAELAPSMRVTAGLDDAARGVDVVEAVLGVGGERASEGLQLADDVLAGLVGLVLEDGAREVPVQLDVAVVRGGQPGDEDLEAPVPSVAIHADASSCFPVQSVEGREQVRRTLDEGDERAPSP